MTDSLNFIFKKKKTDTLEMPVIGCTIIIVHGRETKDIPTIIKWCFGADRLLSSVHW